jgi:hypothetical protein
VKQQLALRKTYVPNRLTEVDWAEQPDWMHALFDCFPNDRPSLLSERSVAELVTVIKFSESLHEQDLVFAAFDVMLRITPLPDTQVMESLKIHPALVFSILKVHPPTEDGSLESVTPKLVLPILQTLMRCANAFSMAVLVAFEKLRATINGLEVHHYCTLVELASLCVRPMNVIQEILLVLNDMRMESTANAPVSIYAQKYSMGVALERAEEAADECPCDEVGKPTKQRSPPSRVKLHQIEDEDKDYLVKADIRIDLPNSIRLHSLVRLQSASKPEKGWVSPWMMDGVVVQAQKGELKIDLLHPPPSEMGEIDWLLYNAGSIGEHLQQILTSNLISFMSCKTANAQAMMDAVIKVSTRGTERCRFASIVTGQSKSLGGSPTTSSSGEVEEALLVNLNDSQRAAVQACRHPLSLIWGPPVYDQVSAFSFHAH